MPSTPSSGQESKFMDLWNFSHFRTLSSFLLPFRRPLPHNHWWRICSLPTQHLFEAPLTPTIITSHHAPISRTAFIILHSLRLILLSSFLPAHSSSVITADLLDHAVVSLGLSFFMLTSLSYPPPTEYYSSVFYNLNLLCPTLCLKLRLSQAYKTATSPYQSLLL